jgi:hypothetical protein
MYLKGQFVVDFVCWVPLDLLFRNDDSSQKWGNLLFWIKCYRIITASKNFSVSALVNQIKKKIIAYNQTKSMNDYYFSNDVL